MWNMWSRVSSVSGDKCHRTKVRQIARILLLVCAGWELVVVDVRLAIELYIIVVGLLVCASFGVCIEVQSGMRRNLDQN